MFSWLRSLRWRVQTFHAIILLLVILIFGSLLHWEMARAHWDRVDDELLGAARILEGSMNAVPPTILEAMSKDVIPGSGPRRRPPLPSRPKPGWTESQPQPGPTLLEQPRRQSMLGWKFPRIEGMENTDRTREEWEASIELPVNLPDQLGRHDGPAYFAIWRDDGSILKESKLPAKTPAPTEFLNRAIDRDRYARQQRGDYREVFVRGPFTTTICVGRPATAELSRASRMMWTLVLSGLSVLSFGLIGGWWISKRAVEPIERMSKTAQRIGGNSLAERIDLGGCDSEFLGLGASLNTMLDRLAQSFEQQRQFTADASHEFRTPLSILLASCELALSKPRTAEEYREQLAKCHRAAARMKELGDSLLTLAQLDANPKLEFESLDISSVLLESAELIRPLAQEKGIRIDADVLPCCLEGNRSMLRQAIDNLISNAIKYNAQNGFVQIRCRELEDAIEVNVVDSGIGIPESALPKLFDRFYRVDESRSRVAGGTGLGLSIVKKILSCHRGEITVTSQVGNGTKMQIVLPKHQSTSPIP
jgi:two-component system, OmpR family, sensor kinase